jgi:hypothetical protein
MTVHVLINRWVSFAYRKYRILVSMLFSLVILSVYHGSAVLKILFHLTVNYNLAKCLLPSRLGIGIAWAYPIFILFLNHFATPLSFSTFGLDILVT